MDQDKLNTMMRIKKRSDPIIPNSLKQINIGSFIYCRQLDLLGQDQFNYGKSYYQKTGLLEDISEDINYNY